jgi:type I restriction enzyme, S subunit
MQKYRPKSKDFLLIIKIKEMGEGYNEKTEKATTTLNKKYVVNSGDVLFSWSASLNIML